MRISFTVVCGSGPDVDVYSVMNKPVRYDDKVIGIITSVRYCGDGVLQCNAYVESDKITNIENFINLIMEYNSEGYSIKQSSEYTYY